MFLFSSTTERPRVSLKFNEGQPPSAYLNAKSPVERHDALADTLLVRVSGNWEGFSSQPDCKTSSTQGPAQTQLVSSFEGRMTAKNRHKNNEKSAASTQEDAPKKSQPSASVSAAGGPGHHGTRSGSCFGLFVTTVFYAALLGAAGFGAFQVQKVVEELRETTARQEESAQRNAAIGTKMDSVVQQVGGGKCTDQWGGRVNDVSRECHQVYEKS